MILGLKYPTCRRKPGKATLSGEDKVAGSRGHICILTARSDVNRTLSLPARLRWNWSMAAAPTTAALE